MSRLTPFHRQLLRMRGIPAAHAAQALHCSVDEVMAGWAELRQRGQLPSLVEHEPSVSEQLSLGDVDRLMREPPSSVEIDHTTDTDPRGW